MDHDYEPVGSMHPSEPFEPDDRDDSFDLVGSFNIPGAFSTGFVI